MIICFFMENAGLFEPQEGGVQRITRILKKEFEKRGYKIYLLTNQLKDSVTNSISSHQDIYFLPDKKINSIQNKTLLHEFISLNNINIFINQSPFNIQATDLLSYIKAHTKTVSVFHNCIECIITHYSSFFMKGVRKIVGNIISGLGLWGLIKWILIQRTRKNWKYAIANSDAFVLYFNSFKEELNEIYNIQSSKIKIIPNPATYEPTLNNLEVINKKMLYVGRIEIVQKRFDRLLMVWKKLHELHPDWTFDVIGEGSYLESAKKIVEEEKLTRIKFHGKQDPLLYFQKADIFTMSSDFEGYGMVLIEAQALGAIPVSFRCYSAIDEVINNGASGIIINNYDIDEMVKEVSSLIHNPHKMLTMRQNGYLQAQLFQTNTITDKWIALLESL